MFPITISLISPKSNKKPFLGEANELKKITSYKQLAEITQQYHWCPSTFNPIEYIDKHGEQKEGRRRTKENVEQTALLVFDVDAGCTLKQAVLDFAPLRHIIVTSRSHQKAKGGIVTDRFRVILFLDGVIKNDEIFKTTWFKIAELFPYIDPACKDISRFYYAGIKIVSVNKGGKLVDVIKGEKIASNMNSNTADLTKGGAIKGRLSSTTMEFLLELPALGGRHGAMIKVLIDLKEQGYTKGEGEEKCRNSYELAGEIWGTKQQARVDDVYDNREVKYPARWPKVSKNRAGLYQPVKNAPENYYYLIEQMGYRPRYNDMYQRREYSDNYMNDDLDLILAKLVNRARQIGLLSSKDTLQNFLFEQADNSHYHPIKDALKEAKLTYDSEYDYIADLEDTLIEAEDASDGSGDMKSEYITKWLVGCMAKIYRPGAQNLVLVLKGGQGIGKSRWLIRLIQGFGYPGLFGEGHINPENKDHVLFHLHHFIYHVPELEGVTSKREVGAMKDFFTKTEVSLRAAFARGITRGYSVCNFCASVNDDEFLLDLTGNRRYMVLDVDKINHVHNIHMPHVFLQAKELLDDGYKYWFEGEAIKRLSARNQQFLMAGPLDDYVSNFIVPGDDLITASEIIELAKVQQHAKNYGILRKLLKARGIEMQQKRVEGRCVRGYFLDQSKLY